MANVGASTSVVTTSSRNNITRLTVTISGKKEREINIKDYGENIKWEILKNIPDIKARTSKGTK